MIELFDKTIECDVLVIGGGIGGLMAAIAAADEGASVIVAEKANTLRSGSGATGNDHFICYIPEYHKDFNEFLKMAMFMSEDVTDRDITEKCMKRSFEVVKDWNDWGINMKPHGDWEFNGHAMPGKMRVYLKYDGSNQKKVLTNQALRRGVRIDNYSPITELLINKNREIAGAVAIDVSKNEPKMKLYKAKTVITATGIGMRLFPSITPGWIGNVLNCPAGTGTGRAAAMRLGATLINMDQLWTHAGPKYMERCGKATWIGYLSDINGKSLSPFVQKPTKELGDFAADCWKGVFDEKKNDGSGPVFMNCTETDEKDMEYMRWGLECEGATSVLEAIDHQNIDLKKMGVEFCRYKPNLQGRGLLVDINHETTISGLYCVGDEAGNFESGIGGAAISGRCAGENAALKALAKESDFNIDFSFISGLRKRYDEILSREGGASWEELNLAIQQIMDDYVGVDFVRSETKMRAGLKYLNDLETYAQQYICANTSHELMRALECFDLIDLGKAVFVSALERRESRGNHQRSDYTFTNPLKDDQLIIVRMKDNELVAEWRQRN
ncbi:MAG: FAD-binding protein [Peptococcaceae bacterium]|nr:FAD-binding protein [Peptococcaceae bacterium]